MKFSGRNKGYDSRGGEVTAKKRKREYTVEYDECGCGSKKFPTQYVCNECARTYAQMMPTPILMSDHPEVIKNGTACLTCDYRAECAGLVVKGWPVKCEIWDELDLTLLAPNSIS